MAAFTRSIFDTASANDYDNIAVGAVLRTEDTFDGRTASSGLGTASDGKAWTALTDATNQSVSGGQAHMLSNAVPNGVVAAATDAAFARYPADFVIDARFSISAIPDATPVRFAIGGRGNSTSLLWGGFIQIEADAGIRVNSQRDGAITTSTTIRIAGYTPGTAIRLKVASDGYAQRAKVWLDGAAEPAWQAISTATRSVNAPNGPVMMVVTGPTPIGTNTVIPQFDVDWVRQYAFAPTETAVPTVQAGSVAFNRTATDSVTTGAGTVVRVIGRPRTATDSLTTGTGTIVRTLTARRTVTDNIAVGADTPVRRVAVKRTSIDTLGSVTDATVETIRGPPQVLRPAADLTNTSWVGEDLRTTGLYASVRDDSDTTWVQSIPGPVAADEQVFTLPVANDPATDSDHIVRYRWSGTGDFAVDLLQGSTVIATWTHNDPAEVPTDAEQTLTPEQAAAITNYGLLRLRVRGI